MDQNEKTNGFPLVEVGLDDTVITDDRAMEILRHHSGLATLNKDAVRSMADLGLYVRGVGVLRKQRGEVTVTQAWLNRSLQVLVDRLLSEGERGSKAREQRLRTYGQLIAALAKAKNESQHLALELEKAAAPSGKPDDIEPARNTSFGTGPVIAAQQVVIHEAKKDLPPSGNGT